MTITVHIMPEDVADLRAWLREKAATAAKSFRAWERVSPGCAAAAYRSGQWRAFKDLEERLALKFP